jgi:hypothetical protein
VVSGEHRRLQEPEHSLAIGGPATFHHHEIERGAERRVPVRRVVAPVAQREDIAAGHAID